MFVPTRGGRQHLGGGRNGWRGCFKCVRKKKVLFLGKKQVQGPPSAGGEKKRPKKERGRGPGQFLKKKKGSLNRVRGGVHRRRSLEREKRNNTLRREKREGRGTIAFRKERGLLCGTAVEEGGIRFWQGRKGKKSKKRKGGPVKPSLVWNKKKKKRKYTTSPGFRGGSHAMPSPVNRGREIRKSKKRGGGRQRESDAISM